MWEGLASGERDSESLFSIFHFLSIDQKWCDCLKKILKQEIFDPFQEIRKLAQFTRLRVEKV